MCEKSRKGDACKSWKKKFKKKVGETANLHSFALHAIIHISLFPFYPINVFFVSCFFKPSERSSTSRALSHLVLCASRPPTPWCVFGLVRAKRDVWYRRVNRGKLQIAHAAHSKKFKVNRGRPWARGIEKENRNKKYIREKEIKKKGLLWKLVWEANAAWSSG